jgi:HAD superfamily hydrolase (TIGR01549 family)
MKAVIFDLDGTLLDSKHTILRCFNAALKEFGFEPFENDALHAMIGMDLRQILATKGADRPEIAERYTEIQMATFMNDLIWYDGVPELLESLKNYSYAIGTATMRRGRIARHILSGLNLLDYFSSVVGADETPESKPSGKHILAVCEALGFSPPQTVVVGDSKYDILSAKEAECLAVGVTWGMGTIDELLISGADHLVDDMTALSELLLNMSRLNAATFRYADERR